MTNEQKVAETHDEEWDEIYDGDQVWSGNPNDALVATLTGQLADMPAGTALDVGCGEGADAVWLASHGWYVTAVDVSRAAISRGRNAAQSAGPDVSTRVTWVCSDVAAAGLKPASFDLVSAFYPALRKDTAQDPCDLLLSLVAPEGVLLFVHHLDVDKEKARAHGCNPDDYVGVDDIRARLDDRWDVQWHEFTRNVVEGRGAHHSRDAVLIARRR